ncbi:MAG: respiratory nitrate reductase subunit gamma [Rhodospirillales bacterium]|jgi:nitrate reductase gamma subunit|nr:respiratory nitrate reductase subunit gamma [Rhodospirillales bacterium]
MWDNFFFIGLPYITIILFFGGVIYRGLSGSMSGHRGKWDMTARGDYLWTTRSTGFFGRASIGPASLCLHWGIVILFLAHLIGFIGGAYNLADWVDFFRWVGLGGGILFLYGVIWAFVRRLVIPQVAAMSTPDDYVILLFLILISGFGLYQSAVELVFGVSYSAGPWIAGVFQLQPDAAMISGAPFTNKLHIILALLFFAYLPFTKLVHIFSYPFGYITRPLISMRRYVALKK